MADSDNPLPQVSFGTQGADTVMNLLFDMASQAMMYGYDADNSTGLVFAYIGGRYKSVEIASDDFTVGASTTTYMVAARSDGTVSTSTSTTNWDNEGAYIRCWKLVSNGSSITSREDHRSYLSPIPPSGFTGGTLTSELNFSTPVTIASASTVNIGAAAGNTINITGTTTITAFDTIAAGARRVLIFAGILTLTHNATSFILPTAANIVTAAGDVAEVESLGSGNWKFIDYQRSNGFALAGSAFTGGTLTSPLNEAPTVTIASAATVNIGAAAGNSISISGTTTITAFDTIAAGAIRRLVFEGALTLTHNATSLIIPGGANLATAAGDITEVLSLGSGNWRLLNYQKANGKALIETSPKILGFSLSDLSTALTTGTGKGYLIMPYAMTLTEVQVGLFVAQTSGSILTVDINEAGSTILSTKLTVDNGEDSSITAATPPVISDASLAKGAKITADIDQLGDGTAKGAIVWLIGI